ncbi:MAG: hypothetical protein MPJ24_06665 [Pirellulaceae bacterium]|nr:hypothetical protein [Pirellulaceae bacterium]
MANNKIRQFTFRPPTKAEYVYVVEVAPYGERVRCGNLALGDKTLHLGKRGPHLSEEMTIVWQKSKEDGTFFEEKISTSVSIKDIPKEKRTNHIIFEYHGDEKWTVRFGEPVK